MEIKIEFNPWSRERLKKGHKSCTSREECKGQVGDVFMVDNVWYELESIPHLPTHIIVDHLFYPEGADSPDELREIFEGLGYQVTRGKIAWMSTHLYVHFFREVME